MPAPKTAVFFYAMGQDEYIIHACASLARLKEKYSKVHLVTTTSCKELANLLGGYDSAFFLPSSGFSDAEVLSTHIAEILQGNLDFYNYSTNVTLCKILGEIAKRNIVVKGIYLDNNCYTSSNKAGMDEVFFSHFKQLPKSSQQNQLSRRDRMLKVLELELYGCLPTPKDNHSSNLIILEGKDPRQSRNYPHFQSLYQLLQKNGWEVFIPSEHKLELHELFLKIESARAVISSDSFISNLGVYNNIATLGLCGPESAEEEDLTNYIQVNQACSPCHSQKCLQQRKNSCLEDIAPRRVIYALNEMLGKKDVTLKIQRPPAIANYSKLCVHIFCYHGLGDALRFALPAAMGLARNHAQCVLHVRQELLSCIGEQPELHKVVGLDPTFAKQCKKTETVLEEVLKGVPPPDLAIGLGASQLEQNIATYLQRSGVNYWGIGSMAENPNKSSSDFWYQTMEYQKSRSRLFSLLGIASLALEETLINPVITSKPNIVTDKEIIGLHTKALWPARCYNKRKELIEILQEKYYVWNFDENPCESLGLLAWYIKESKAVLSVDTMVSHLCNALQTPALIMQGPVWHHKDHAPHVLDICTTVKEPKPNGDIDRDSQALSKVSPQEIANEFFKFTDSL